MPGLVNRLKSKATFIGLETESSRPGCAFIASLGLVWRSYYDSGAVRYGSRHESGHTKGRRLVAPGDISRCGRTIAEQNKISILRGLPPFSLSPMTKMGSIPAFATICNGICNFCMHIHLDIVSIGVGPLECMLDVYTVVDHGHVEGSRGNRSSDLVSVFRTRLPNTCYLYCILLCYNLSYFSPRRVVIFFVLCFLSNSTYSTLETYSH